jgi:cytochrome c-type biogenesis protein CcmH/NrfG
VNPGLIRWSDDRLDDLANRVHEHHQHLARLDDLITAHAVFAERLGDVARDTARCLSTLDQLKADMSSSVDQQRRDRKLDRRWLIATALTVAAIIVAALGVFIG